MPSCVMDSWLCLSKGTINCTRPLSLLALETGTVTDSHRFLQEKDLGLSGMASNSGHTCFHGKYGLHLNESSILNTDKRRQQKY